MKKDFGVNCEYSIINRCFIMQFDEYPDYPPVFHKYESDEDQPHFVSENELIHHRTIQSVLVHNKTLAVSREIKYIEIEKSFSLPIKILNFIYSMIYPGFKKDTELVVDKVSFVNDFKSAINELAKTKPELFHDIYR